jgi:hypothetical protein
MRIAEYQKPRLYFDADVIEPLDWSDRIRIVCRDGTFEMTKRQFYDTFENVVSSRSYQIDRWYHYSRTPQKAMVYLVRN